MDKYCEQIIRTELLKVIQKAFNEGVETGIQQMEDKIQKHCEIGKPVLANGDLYFFQDSQEHLREIMDSFDQPREK
ncbi:hypothetical protein I6E50_07415 [Roseburia hominis]|uniref:hypothetical protein n=1 Tax=Roseburia hominis TaxID=301301 RepID=UPI001F33960E|nr:hypothetical protein [Roseburia hominis]